MTFSLHTLDSQNMMVRSKPVAHSVSQEFGAALAKPLTASPYGSSIALNYLNVNKMPEPLKVEGLQDRKSDLVFTEFHSITPNIRHWSVQGVDTSPQPSALINASRRESLVSEPTSPVQDDFVTEGVVGQPIDKFEVSSAVKRGFNSLNNRRGL